MDHLWSAALAEHFQTHFRTEWYYHRELSRINVEPEALTMMLQEFRVARTITEDGKKSLLDSVNNWANKPLQVDQNDWVRIKIAAKELGKQKFKKKKCAYFASGMSKVLSFAGGHRYPMFDKYTSKALKVPVGKPALERLECFYDRLDKIDYLNCERKATAILNEHNLKWAASSRLLDKFLFLIGISNNEKLDKFHSSHDLFFESLPENISCAMIECAKSLSRSSICKEFQRKIEDGEWQHMTST